MSITKNKSVFSNYGLKKLRTDGNISENVEYNNMLANFSDNITLCELTFDDSGMGALICIHCFMSQMPIIQHEVVTIPTISSTQYVVGRNNNCEFEVDINVSNNDLVSILNEWMYSSAKKDVRVNINHSTEMLLQGCSIISLDYTYNPDNQHARVRFLFDNMIVIY